MLNKNEYAPVAQMDEQSPSKAQVVGSNPAGGTIRILDKNDNKELSELIKNALKENIFIVKKKNHHFFGYFVDDKLVGIVGYFTMKKYKTIGFINAFVLPEYRKFGFYKKLSEERFNFCVENYKGFKIFVSVNNKSKPQIEKLGFKLIERQYRMYLIIAS